MLVRSGPKFVRARLDILVPTGSRICAVRSTDQLTNAVVIHLTEMVTREWRLVRVGVNVGIATVGMGRRGHVGR